jgi:hypothetical protein
MSEDRSGIDRLRTAIEEVARDIEGRERRPARPRPARWLALAAAATVILVVLLIGIRGTATLRPAPREVAPEVKVLVLKINGRDVRPRIVEDGAPATIIVMPQTGGETPPAAAGVLLGGTR